MSSKSTQKAGTALFQDGSRNPLYLLAEVALQQVNCDFLTKSSTDSAEENRAVPQVGSV